MDKTILVAGKDIPAGSDFAAALCVKGRTTIVTATPSEKNEPIAENGYTAVPWNRASALSARALLLSCLNISQHLDEAVLLFDEPYLAAEYNHTDLAENARVIDELVLGYQYLAQEVIARFEQKKTRGEESASGKIVFMHKTNPSHAEATGNPALRAGTISSPLVSAAAAAFKAFAENTAALHAENTAIYPVLVTCDPSIEVSHKDSTLSAWLCDYLDSVDELKKRPASKQLVSWVKAGTKKAGGFGLF